MDWILSLFLLIFLFVFWLVIDYQKGKRSLREQHTKRIYPIRKGHIELITNGAELYKRYFQDLQAAKHSIHILFYIVQYDPFSQVFIEILQEKAQSGVDVYVLLDWVGSRNIPNKWIRKARKAGINIEYCHRPRLPYLFFTLQQRNHRKITIVDGTIGYLGGYNVGLEYIDFDPKLSPWRDYHLRLRGKGVHDLLQEFSFDWQRATGEKLELTKSEYNHQEDTMAYQLYPTEGVGMEETIVNIIHQAKKTLTIGTPYFIPPENIMVSLEEALQRGVKVTLLVPKIPDHPIVKEASYPFLRRLLRLGGKVYQFEKGFFHAKVIVIDGEFCDIGSANMDYRSIHINFEINCFIYDQVFIQEVEETIRKDIEQSKELTLEDLEQITISEKIKQGVGWVLRKFL